MITYDEFVKVAMDIVGANPDFVYPRDSEEFDSQTEICQYRKGSYAGPLDNVGGEPSCIVSHIAEAFGVLDQMPEEVPAATALGEIGFEDRTLRFALKLQNAQDSGFSWSQSLDYALGEYSSTGHYGESTGIEPYVSA